MYKPKTENAYYYRALPSNGHLNIKLPSELHAEAKAKAKAEGLTLSSIVKNLLIDYITKH